VLDQVVGEDQHVRRERGALAQRRVRIAFDDPLVRHRRARVHVDANE
jgi:hypothetical protein